MKAYIYSILVCALDCGILASLISSSKRKKLIHLISGTVLAISILRPLSQIDPDFSLDILLSVPSSTDYYISEGKEAALDAKKESIEEACTAYILNRAQTLGTEISVHFFLNEDLIPYLVEIQGNVDSDAQMQLENILSTDLGIPKENQKWIWQQEDSS